MSKQLPRLRKVEKCDACGRRMRRTIQDRYPYLESGLSNVVLDHIPVYKCECGEQIVGLPNVERLHGLIFEKILMKKGALRGDELRFLRKSMSLKSADFAKMLNVHAATLSKWESGDQAISEEHDKLIRFAVLVSLSERAKKQFAEAHQRVADQYLDMFKQVQATAAGDVAQGTVEITQQELDELPLTLRWSLTHAPDVELIS